MPSLVLRKSPGGTPGETIALDGDLFVIGRDADTCQIVIPHHAVSRRHAQITRTNTQYFIEDLRSRNNTFVNNKQVTTRTQLKPSDRIKICDFLFEYQDERVKDPAPIPEWMKKDDAGEEDDPGGNTTIEATGSRVNAQNFLDSQGADRLKALLAISQHLSRTLELDPLLEQIAEVLLKEFRQADRVFLILLDENGKAIPKATKARRPGLDESRFSKTIVKKAVESLKSFLSEDASSDASLGPAASIAEFRIRSVMCVPLVSPDGKALGAIQMDTQDRAKKFTTDDLNLLSIVANLAAVAVEKANLHAVMLNSEKEKKEIEIARAVQLGFLPQSWPEIPGYEFYSAYSPAQSIGGDYYDYIHLPDGKLAIVLGDVAGKGVPAALLVAKLSSEVRYSLLTQTEAAKSVQMLNDQMIRGGLGDRFVTLAAMILDPKKHSLVIVNAGHMSPRLLNGDTGQLSDAISNDQTGLPLGVMPEFEFESTAIQLEPGDILATFTDGVTDSMNPAGELFGFEGVDKYMSVGEVATDSVLPKKLGEKLMAAVRKHANGRAQNDDIALIVFGRLPASAGPGTGVTARTTQKY
jgi:serine phosphatase RsbU (regulator of sigma subunit)